MASKSASVAWYKGSAFYLFVALVVFYVFNSALSRSWLGEEILTPLLFFTIIVLGVRAIRPDARAVLVAVGISAALLVAERLLVRGEGDDDVSIPRLTLRLTFLLFTSCALLRVTLRGEKVTTDKIFAAICVYFLIGVSWAVMFEILYACDPRSLSIPPPAGEVPPGGKEAGPHLVYFSFTTLTTLGYGDITPKSVFARNLATFEALLGQLYIATMLARLVALQITHADREAS